MKMKRLLFVHFLELEVPELRLQTEACALTSQNRKISIFCILMISFFL